MLALQKVLPGMFEEGEEEEFFWLDIFCLDQFKADQMKTFVQSDQIYGWAVKYYGMGLAIFDQVWCLAEITCSGKQAHRLRKSIIVTEFEGYLGKREGAHKDTKLRVLSAPTFKVSRRSGKSDREIVETRILNSGFATIHEFDAYVKSVADKTLQPLRELFGGTRMMRRGGWGILSTMRVLSFVSGLQTSQENARYATRKRGITTEREGLL